MTEQMIEELTILSSIEMGHAIDYFYGKENEYGGFFSSNYTDSNGMSLFYYNKQDVNNTVNNEIDALFQTAPYNTWSAAVQQKARDVVVNNLINNNLNHSNLTSDEQTLQRSVSTSISSSLRGAENEAASDVYGGISGNLLRGNYGHPDNYWVNTDGTINQTTEKECFAEYYGIIMTEDPRQTDGLNSINNHLPNSQDFMDQMFLEMS